jgi:hypothetical protein
MKGVAGLKRDKTRPSRVRPLPRETRLKVIAKPEENDEILDLCFNHCPGQQLHMTLGMGIRQMHEDGLDFVDRTMIKKLSMEFYWKRKPYNPRDIDVILPNGERHRQLCFETVPWDDINQFQTTRERWYSYNKESPHEAVQNSGSSHRSEWLLFMNSTRAFACAAKVGSPPLLFFAGVAN